MGDSETMVMNGLVVQNHLLSYSSTPFVTGVLIQGGQAYLNIYLMTMVNIRLNGIIDSSE